MIISLSGYAKTGKDTVCKLIQLELAGGPDKHYTIEDVVQRYGEHQWWLEEQSGWERRAWADKLKQVASILTGIPVEKFHDQAFKDSYLPSQWDRLRIHYINGITGKESYYDFPAKTTYVEAFTEVQQQLKEMKRKGYSGTAKLERKPMTVREFIQRLGTEAIRYGLHPDAWVNALMSEYVPQIYPNTAGKKGGVGGDALTEEYPSWIISDTRMPNEYEAVKNRGGILVRVERKGVGPANDHESEVALDGHKFDYVIHNDGDLYDLQYKVQAFLRHFKLIGHEPAHSTGSSVDRKESNT